MTINRYRSPTHFSTRWPDSKHVGDPSTVAAFDEDGLPIYIDQDELGGGGGTAGGGGPDGTVTITEDTVLDEATHGSKLLIVNNEEPITITLPEFTTANSFIYIKKRSSSDYPIVIVPYDGATLDDTSESITIETQFVSLHIFYSSVDTFYIL